MSVVQGLSVEEVPFAEDEDGGFHREFTLHLQFHKLTAYPDQLGLTWHEISATVSSAFSKAIEKAIVRHFRRAAFQPSIESVAVNAQEDHDVGAAEGDGVPGEEAANAAKAADGNEGDEDEDENREVRRVVFCVALLPLPYISCLGYACVQRSSTAAAAVTLSPVIGALQFMMSFVHDMLPVMLS